MQRACQSVSVDLGPRTYRILIADGLFANGAAARVLTAVTAKKRVLLVADSHTEPLFAGFIRAQILSAGAAAVEVVTFPAGETSKHLGTVEKICRAAADYQLDRSSVIAALGGGVTGDLAGFAAAIFMRGIPFFQIPTSLLAMVDSSVGGKTGADLPEGKNLIGAFHQPKTVLMDCSFLKFLPRRELSCGFAELIKHGVILDSKLFSLLSKADPEAFLDLASSSHETLSALASILAKSCRIKGSVVEMDEHEGSLRALLNYGHSFGHAIEKALRFSGLNHGEAISVGMAMAASLAVRTNLLKQTDADRQDALLQRFGLPIRVSGVRPREILQFMHGDKKNIGGKMRLILPRAIGKAEIVEGIPQTAILRAIEAHCD